jgi:hypothetical protein
VDLLAKVSADVTLNAYVLTIALLTLIPVTPEFVPLQVTELDVTPPLKPALVTTVTCAPTNTVPQTNVSDLMLFANLNHVSLNHVLLVLDVSTPLFLALITTHVPLNNVIVDRTPVFTQLKHVMLARLKVCLQLYVKLVTLCVKNGIVSKLHLLTLLANKLEL